MTTESLTRTQATQAEMVFQMATGKAVKAAGGPAVFNRLPQKAQRCLVLEQGYLALMGTPLDADGIAFFLGRVARAYGVGSIDL